MSKDDVLEKTSTLLGIAPGELETRQRRFDSKLAPGERREGFQLRFDGEQAGMWGHSFSGDRNDPTNYMVVCPCGADLGQLGRFRPNREGFRSPRCLVCDQILWIDEQGSLQAVFSGAQYDEILRKKQAKALEAAREAAFEIEERLTREGGEA